MVFGDFGRLGSGILQVIVKAEEAQMSRKQKQLKDAIQVNIKGNVSGQIAIGNNNTQTQSDVHYSVTVQEMDGLRQILNELRTKVEAIAEPENKISALEQVQKLEQAITAKKPSLSKMEKVKNWFGKNAPALAGAVTSVIVHPIVGKLVEAGGDMLVKEFQERFGNS